MGQDASLDQTSWEMLGKFGNFLQMEKHRILFKFGFARRKSLCVVPSPLLVWVLSRRSNRIKPKRGVQRPLQFISLQVFFVHQIRLFRYMASFRLHHLASRLGDEGCGASSVQSHLDALLEAGGFTSCQGDLGGVFVYFSCPNPCWERLAQLSGLIGEASNHQQENHILRLTVH